MHKVQGYRKVKKFGGAAGSKGWAESALIHVFGLDQHEISLHNRKLSRLDYGNQYVASNNAVQFYKIIGKFSNLITKLRVMKISSRKGYHQSVYASQFWE